MKTKENQIQFFTASTIVSDNFVEHEETNVMETSNKFPCSQLYYG